MEQFDAVSKVRRAHHVAMTINRDEVVLGGKDKLLFPELHRYVMPIVANRLNSIAYNFQIPRKGIYPHRCARRITTTGIHVERG